MHLDLQISFVEMEICDSRAIFPCYATLYDL